MQATARSTDQHDYQHLAPAVVAMSKTFPGGASIAPHSHPRDQLLYAVRGTMRVRTETASWIVSPDRALYIPAGTEHAIAIRGHLEMRTLYIMPDADARLPRSPAMLLIGDLLRALVLALLDEPMDYAADGRGGFISWLILDEIVRGPQLAIDIPMPTDRRLARVCERLMDDPACALTLDRLADEAGASARTLARLFKSQCHIPFTLWRQRVRFMSAIEGLANGLPIGEVARGSGYVSASAFTAAFRRTFGYPPRRMLHSAGARPQSF